MRFALLLLALLPSFAARADEVREVQESTTVESLPAARAELPPDFEAVAALIEAERKDVAQLQEQLAAASSHDELLRLERAISERRLQLQVELLELRHRQAVDAGQPELAASIRAQIEEFQNPRLPAEPKRPLLPPHERAKQND